MRFIDMFCGIGGFRLGLEKANQEEGLLRQSDLHRYISEPNECRESDREAPSRHRSKKSNSHFTCVWSNDNDRYACQIYRKHFGEVYEGDIRAVDASSIPEHDLLCAGFPCQDFSIAGKRRGIEGARGTLFFEICRVLRAKRPSYVFLENVRGLQSSDDGRAFGIILTSLDELGYDCQWQVLNSKDYGVPQNRERVFIIGHLRGKPRSKVFPIGEASQRFVEGTNDPATVRTLQGGGHSGGHHSGMSLIYEGAIMSEENQKWLEDGKRLSRNFPQGQRVYSTEGIASSICGDAGGLGGKTGLYEVKNIQKSGRGNNKIEIRLREGFGTVGTAKGGDSRQEQTFIIQPILTPDRENKRQHGRRMKEDGEPMFTLTGQDVHGVVVHNLQPRCGNSKEGGTGHLTRNDGIAYALDSGGTQAVETTRIRRLTPLECERLQGFPDNWTEGISDTQRYKCLGNAVTVNVIEAIGRSLLG